MRSILELKFINSKGPGLIGVNYEQFSKYDYVAIGNIVWYI